VTSVCIENRKDNTHVKKYYDQLEELADLYKLSLAKVHLYWENRISVGNPV